MNARLNLVGIVMAMGLMTSLASAQEAVEAVTPAQAEISSMPVEEVAPVAKLPSLTVVDFAAEDHTDMTHGLPELISEALVNSGLFDVFERERLATLIQEQNLQTSGMVDAETAISLGKLSGVKYIVTGKIMNFGRELKTFNGYGANTQTAFYRLKADMKVIETETGKVLFSKTADAEEKQFSASAYDNMDTTMASKLAEKVSAKLVSAMLANTLFKPAAPAGSDKISVAITSLPDGADVEVDGVYLGNTGRDYKLTAGMHEVKISLPGYEEWIKKVQVQEGSSFKANLVKKADVRVEIDQKTEVAPVETAAPVVAPVEAPAETPAEAPAAEPVTP